MLVNGSSTLLLGSGIASNTLKTGKFCNFIVFAKYGFEGICESCIQPVVLINKSPYPTLHDSQNLNNLTTPSVQDTAVMLGSEHGATMHDMTQATNTLEIVRC